MYRTKIILTFFCFYSFSCVYFNTFYNAKNSFKKANEIIDNDSSSNYDNNDISNTAKKLLKESISSSNIVITKYPDSKYVDDAIYYMARSYFSLSEFYKAEKNFKQLVENYSDSKYYNESRLWLEYSHLKLNSLDSILVNVNSIQNELDLGDSDNYQLFFLLHNLKGDFFVQTKDFENAFLEFEKALEFVNSKSKKTMLYSKLSIISEQEEKFEKVVKYLDEVQILSSNKDTQIEAFRRWIEAMKQMRKYDQIILRIQENINTSNFESQRLQDEFNMQLAIIYMESRDFSESKNLFNDIINNTNQKSIKCQCYYWLGYISLFYEFDLDLSAEYFDLVLETMRTSDFSKKTKTYLNEIDSYNQVLNQYNSLESNDGAANLSNHDKNESLLPNNLKNTSEFLINKDSLLFIIAEKLYFDFNQADLAIDKHQELIENYPSSDYTPRSKQIINKLRGIESNYLDNKIDSLKMLRDSAWNLLSYDKDKSVQLFNDIAQKYNDYQSYYSLGIIYEDYLYQPDLGIKYYLESFNCIDEESSQENQNFKRVLKNKLLLLEEAIKNKIDTINQKNNYTTGFNFLINEFNLDSAKSYFNMSLYIKESNELNSLIDSYIKNSDELNELNLKDSILYRNVEPEKYTRSEIDSIFLDLANTSFWFFRQTDLSKKYLDLMIINDSSKYYDSYIQLNNRIQNNNFKVDTSEKKFNLYFSKSKNYYDYYDYMASLKKKHKDDLAKYNSLLNYFSEKMHESDDLNTNDIDTMEVNNLYKNNIPVINGNNIVPNIDLDIKINNE